MAIYHCSIKPISRSAGRSAVAAIAYRTASLLVNERDGIVHDFTAKQGVAHCEIVLPDGIEADWALDRSTLWNATEAAERRSDARVAREFEIALPHELDTEERLSLTRAFAKSLTNDYGTAVDFAIHLPQGKSDDRNIHAHVMMTTRVVTNAGLGEKSLIERENKWLIANNQPTSHSQVRDIRMMFADQVNRHLRQAGLDLRIDHRSHADRDIEIEPTGHMGVHASQMRERGLDVSRNRIEEAAAKRNADLVRRRPQEVLSLITDEKSVFDRYDVARTLHRYITDNQAFRNALAAVMASSQLVELKQEEQYEPAHYTTREMIAIEQRMADSAIRMAARSGYGVRSPTVDRAIAGQDKQLAGSRLSDEQRAAIRHITGSEQIATVIGFAGAGKSTMLTAARTAWEAEGYRVHGAALAGKAAEGLSASSGIVSRTLASWELGWRHGKGELGRNDIFVIDEAGMVDSRQLARFVSEVEAHGAKLVLVGDHEQLQAIGAGSPFRAIAERTGSVELKEIRRQNEDWQRQASIAFATHRTGEGLRHYADRGDIRFADDREQARAELVRDYLADRKTNSQASRLALAHRRIDVRAINDAIRESLQAAGLLAKRRATASDDATTLSQSKSTQTDREITYQTVNGARAFGAGDRIVLLQNNRELDVKNGMLGTVEAVEPDALHMRLDGNSGDAETGRRLTIHAKDYQAFDHGYATTIHKAQGATIDRSFVMASATMDRHLTYVAMTRHRHKATLYAGRDELAEMKQMVASMSRSGLKETTLDYVKAFAERRGLNESLGEEIRQEPTLRNTSVQTTLERERHRAEGDGMAHSVHHHDHHHRHQRQDVPAPLVPAITRYDKSVDEVARETLRPNLEQNIERLRAIARHVYQDGAGACDTIKPHVLDPGTDPMMLARTIRERPEQFGALRGKSGIFGNNSERKEALQSARALATHIDDAVRTWRLQFNEARASETWKRENCDPVEVASLSHRSETILKTLDKLSHNDGQKFLEQMVTTAEGRKALTEANTIVSALKKRFGTADWLQLAKMDMRGISEVAGRIDRIMEVAHLAGNARLAELTRQRPLERNLSQTRGLRM
jgi:Ti-type conjugative transfer relaxase TraA